MNIKLIIFAVFLFLIGSAIHAQDSISINDLFNDYTTSTPAVFGSKFKNKYIDLKGGVISSIENGNGNIELIVYLKDPQVPTLRIRAEFPRGAVDEANDLIVANDGMSATILVRKTGANVKSRQGRIQGEKPFLFAGQTISIKGLFKQISVNDIILTQCQFEHALKEKGRMHKFNY